MPTVWELARGMVGLSLLVAPGVVVVRTFLPGLDWAKGAAVAVVVGLTVPPLVLFVLSAGLGVPVTAVSVAAVSAAISVAAVASARLSRRNL